MEVGLCCVLICIMLCWPQRRLLAALLSCSMRSACTAWHGMNTQGLLSCSQRNLQ